MGKEAHAIEIMILSVAKTEIHESAPVMNCKCMHVHTIAQGRMRENACRSALAVSEPRSCAQVNIAKIG